MKSATYTRKMCDKCRAKRMAVSTPKGPLYPHPIVYWWVRLKVEKSAYIRGLTGGCIGCAEVYEDSCLVLGVLLHKLGINICRGLKYDDKF